MSIAELKVEMLEIITSVQNEDKASRMVEALRDIADDETTDYNLTSEQETELLESLQESYDPTNWITHDDMKKKHAKWLRK
jgi:hypothetical protein